MTDGYGKKLSALNVHTNKLVFPIMAIDLDKYICPECNKPLQFIKRSITRRHFRHHPGSGCSYKLQSPTTISTDDIENYVCPECCEHPVFVNDSIKPGYFRHFSSTECDRYDNPGESKIHKEGKEIMKYILEQTEIPIKIERKCLICKIFMEYDIEKDIGKYNVYEEYRFKYNGEDLCADVALINNNPDSIKYIFEIYYTHRTSEEKRPDPWFEIKAEDLINIMNSDESIEDYKIQCIRKKICLNCSNSCESEFIEAQLNKEEFCWKKEEEKNKKKEKKKEDERKKKDEERKKKEEERREKEAHLAMEKERLKQYQEKQKRAEISQKQIQYINNLVDSAKPKINSELEKRCEQLRQEYGSSLSSSEIDCIANYEIKNIITNGGESLKLAQINKFKIDLQRKYDPYPYPNDLELIAQFKICSKSSKNPSKLIKDALLRLKRLELETHRSSELTAKDSEMLNQYEASQSRIGKLLSD